jgi:hypothetical protein
MTQNLIRDPNSKAIINNDYESYRKYIDDRNHKLDFVKTKKDVSNLQKDIKEIKEMLQQLINGKVNG